MIAKPVISDLDEFPGDSPMGTVAIQWPEKRLLAGAALAASATANASETVVYSYDPLGRLVAAATSGSVNDGLSVSTG